MYSAQPLTGTNGRRCKEDERLINATLRPGKRGYIIDTRSITAAQQARAKGGGFEQEAHYPQWRRIHKSIERSVKSTTIQFILIFISICSCSMICRRIFFLGGGTLWLTRLKLQACN